MGLKLILTDTEIPASPAFIEFLYAFLTDRPYHVGEWFMQEGEGLAMQESRLEDVQKKAAYVLAEPRGAEYVIRSYRFFKEMLTGKPDTLRSLQRFHFFFVIGIPRTGGTYIIKQLFRAAGVDYKHVHNALAHDGFPHLSHLMFQAQSNIHTTGLLQLAEYLTMVDLYFTKYGKLAYKGGVLVPKKFTKAIYNFPLIRELLGDHSTFLVTLRHPLGFAQSVMDKSGGMPLHNRFAIRSAIERWALDDWLHWGYTEASVLAMDYTEVLLGYWKRFHFQMALSGVLRMPGVRVVPYGVDSMTQAARDLFQEFSVSLKPEIFKSSETPLFDKRYQKLAGTYIEEVRSTWKSLELSFPEEGAAV